MNNSKPTSDLEKFESIWPSYWLEDDFRSKTLSQIIKDFWLSGIILNLEDLQKYKTLDSLADYLNKTIRDNNLKDYRVIKSRNTNNSLWRQILSSNLNKKNHNLNFECLSLRSSMTAILSFESTGC